MKQPSPRKPRFRIIVVRGCKMRVASAKADAVEREERRLLRQEWDTNTLTE